MIVISSREFRENQKKYFDLAQIQRVIIKRKNQFFELVSHGNIIPEEKAPTNKIVTPGLSPPLKSIAR